MAIQKKSGRMAKKEWIPEDACMTNQFFLLKFFGETLLPPYGYPPLPGASAHKISL